MPYGTALTETDQHHTVAPDSGAGRRWLTTAVWAAAAVLTVSLLILALYVASHPDIGAGLRGTLLALGTAGVAVSAVIVLAGLCERTVLDRLTRRDRRSPDVLGEVASLRGEVAALRGEQAATREEVRCLLNAVAVCGAKLGTLPEEVAAQVRPVVERVAALEGCVEGLDQEYDRGYVAGAADTAAAVGHANGQVRHLRPGAPR